MKLALLEPTEKSIQTAVKRLLDQLDVAYYDTSQPHRALITPGLPDLLCFSGRHGLFFVECKSARGRLSSAQQRFRDHAVRAGVPYLVARSVTDVAVFLAGSPELSARIPEISGIGPGSPAGARL